MLKDIYQVILELSIKINKKIKNNEIVYRIKIERDQTFLLFF